MPGTPTPRLGLATIDGATDAVSSYPAVNLSQMDILDNALLQPVYTAFATSGTAADGQLAVGAPGVTITLPAIGSLSKVIVVQANSTVTGANPVTVAAGGGQTISGVGASGVSSILLGTAFATVTLFANAGGSAWEIISGQQDTGWVALTLSTNWVAWTGYTPAARLIGDRVWLCGKATNQTGGNSITPFGTFPASVRPASQVDVGAQLVGGGSENMTIAPAGTASVAPTVANNATLSLDDLSYRFV
jgi:hypothetical protein